MIRSVARLCRRTTAPVAVLLVLTLQPAPAAARPGGPVVPRSGPAGTTVSTRLAPPAGLAPGIPAAAAPGMGAPQPACDPAKLPKGDAVAVDGRQAVRITHDGAQVVLKAGAVKGESAVVATSLCDSAMAPMDQSMTNVTAGPRRGYRFMPHQTFLNEVTVTLPYDPALIPLGLTELDVYTYFYDDVSAEWLALQRVSIDAEAHTITSLTDHFTDFVNATLTVPDHPEGLSYNPTSIKDIKAADPAAAVNLISPPQATNNGNAALSYPIEVPPGRGGMTPVVGLRYDSAGTNGWLGMGWDLAMPSVTIDTRWGVPRYNGAQETETYSFGGEDLTPVAHRGPLVHGRPRRCSTPAARGSSPRSSGTAPAPRTTGGR